MRLMFISVAMSISPLPRQEWGKIKKTSLSTNPILSSSSSSKFSRTNVVTVVMMPMKRFAQLRATKAEEGTEKANEAGYIRGTEENPYRAMMISREGKLSGET